MHARYNIIDTFADDDPKGHIRKNIFNPLIDQHNQMSIDISKTSTGLLDQVNKLSVMSYDLQNITERLEDVELGGGSGGGDVDLTPIMEQLAALVEKDTSLDTAFDESNIRVDKIADDVLDVTARVGSLELGGGGSGDVDLSPILKRLDETDAKVVILEDKDIVSDGKVSLLEESDLSQNVIITKLSEDVTALQNKPDGGGVTTPTKWYVLPLAGQSNMSGFGELLPDLPEIDPRLMQLGYLSSIKTTAENWASNIYNVPPVATIFGDKFDLYRPYEDCNLKLIPSTYCLDNQHNLMSLIHFSGRGSFKRPGGLVGVGHYLAGKLLDYIPKGYGILIVDGSRGSTGFGDENPLGTYDSVKMHASAGARRWGVDTPFGNQFYDRVKFALELNPENKLLPVIWFQGESDKDPSIHFDRFRAYVKHFRDSLATDGLGDRVPTKNPQDFRWICLGTTKIAYGENLYGKDHLDRLISYDSPWASIRANYDNYAYLMSDPEFIKGSNKESQIISSRIDIDSNGDFFETVIEELADSGKDSVASSQTDWHFSSSTLMYRQPSYLVNILSAYGKCINGYVPSRWNRNIRGRRGFVSTDNVTFQYNKSASDDFDPSVGLLVHIDKSKEIEYTLGGITVTPPTCAIVNDPLYGNVYDFDGNTSHAGSVNFVVPIKDYTYSVVFKPKKERRNIEQSVLGPINERDYNTPWLGLYKGSFVACTSIKNLAMGVMLNKSYLGAWNGMYDDWQHVCMTRYAGNKYVSVYLNGCLVETIPTEGDSMVTLKIGAAMNSLPLYGRVSSLRIYNKSLSKTEIASLNILDSK